MTRRTLPRKKKPVDLSQADPRGRVDVLASECLKRIFGRHPNPAVRDLYETFSPLIDGFLFQKLHNVRIPGVPQAPPEIERRARRPRVVKAKAAKKTPKVQVIDIRPIKEEAC